MINKRDSAQVSIDEVHEIMVILRGDNATRDGDYRNIHLGTVLEYLYSQKEENKDVTLSKLALMLGMAARQVRENYIKGLEAFGIITLDATCKNWHWVGIKAIKGKYGQLKKNTPEDNEFVANQLKHNGDAT